MMLEMLPQINIEPNTIAGITLWAFALYLSLSSLRDWLMTQLMRWFNFAERSLYFSTEEFERTREARESQNAFYASIFSIFPFLIIGIFCNYGVEASLGRSWAISVGLLACMAFGIYELGRQSQQ
ncbi:hypothetical protein FRE64_07875 [Euhalothece natronophila Z-M001]|uniref:Uncharacterized protein n=1 Tax=Euhalothece natronophila Z-M001 TaxID=522448 RepID=A0A5B8NR74_9CHRO|nr:hypothetical protein [Euhalothece natronophila]QDZ41477.1 hypothetical protein FRE64_07875 [Euhalothece natronophila Z-M001]